MVRPTPDTVLLFHHEAGILLHPTSLPGPYGVGDLGPAAHRWLELLAAAGQTLWQVLPLHPTGFGDSPYQATSSYAGHPLLISPDALVADGLLTAEEVAAAAARCRGGEVRVDFVRARAARGDLLEQAAVRFFGLDESAPLRVEFAAFIAREELWLRDHALYTAIKAQQDGAHWTEWPVELRDRAPAALAAIEVELGAAMRRAQLQQFLFDRQWRALRDRARALGIRVVGDLPIFVAHDSVDVWVNRELFLLGDRGQPTVVAGVPPDYFAETGQLWGNPIYDWERHQADGFAWWLARARHLLQHVDVVRVDHFRGFVACWEIPAGDETAENGAWVEAPGRALFTALEEALGRPLPMIAEDLGVITDDVLALRDDFGLPGMRVLQFGFGAEKSAAEFLPDAYVPNCVAYTGTHDNDTIVGWFRVEPGADSTRTVAEISAERARVRDYFGIEDGAEIHWDAIRALHASRAGAVVVPLQDVLGIDSGGRMNVPGRDGDSWTWRLSSFEDLRAAWPQLAEITRDAGR